MQGYNKLTKVFIPVFFLFLFSISSLAACIVELNKETYSPLERATAEIVVTTNPEKSSAYTGNWTNSSEIQKSFVGVTPDVVGDFFFEEFDIPSGVNWTEGRIDVEIATTGETCFDTFNVTGADANELVISDIVFSKRKLIGNELNFEFTVTHDDSILVNNAFCVAHIENGNDLPIETSMSNDGSPTEIITYDGSGSYGQILLPTNFEETQQYALELHCICGNTGTNRACFDQDSVDVDKHFGTTVVSFQTEQWMNSTTIVDKTSYTLDDNIIKICAQVQNFQEKRIPIRVNYNVRCGEENPTGVDRSLLDGTIVQERGISGNITQTQCAEYNIKNIPSIQNNVNTCYAATEVDVLRADKEAIMITYATRSGNFTIDSDSSFLDEGGNEMLIIMGIILAFIIIFLIIGGVTQDDTLIALSAMLMIVTGIFLWVNGLQDVKNFWTDTFSIVIVGMGMYFMVAKWQELVDIMNKVFKA